MHPQKFKILLIEDDSFLANLYIGKFSNEGFAVIRASHGEEGLTLAKKIRPRAILLDLLLPGLDGFSVLQSLKKDLATQEIPVIVLTNSGEEENINKALDLGAADYLIKVNFLPSEVVEKVRGVIAE
ncbi:response regulator [Patescibacteria group bacterium]|nr:response regulator [Patescibacteria group bacterium]MBU4511961.1 response regulator [Patescibacteria group bacterium]MCG2693365.1 response regulator [Candidatus Parcubacteria bacterium]